MSLGENIKNKRKLRNYSIEQLSQLTTIPVERLKNFELDILKPTDDELKSIAKALDCSVAELLGDTKQKKEISPFVYIIVAIVLLIIVCVLFPLATIIYNFSKINIKNIKKPINTKYNKIAKLFLIIAIIYYTIGLTFIVLTILDIFEFSVVIFYLLICGIAYLTSYLIFYIKCLKNANIEDKIETKSNNEKELNNIEKREKKSNEEDSTNEKESVSKYNNDNEIEKTNIIVDESNTTDDNNDEMDYEYYLNAIKYLKQYKELLDSNIITIEEFNKKKHEILDIEV